MNKIIKKMFLNSDKFMPELHLRQPGFTNSEYGPLLRIVKEKEGISQRKRKFKTNL